MSTSILNSFGDAQDDYSMNHNTTSTSSGGAAAIDETTTSATTTTSTTEDVLPLNLVSIRIWDIDENATHYDKLVAAPTDREMWFMWIFWSLIMAAVAIVTGFIFVAIVCSKKARTKNAFNGYLLALMAPDFVMSFACFITCWINASTGYFASVGLCYAQSFYFIFGIGANSWLNAVIAYRLYNMLRDAKEFRKKYTPPTWSQVVRHSILVYLWAAFVASWGLMDVPWLPHHTRLVLGTACIPMDYNTASTIFFYCAFFPALLGIPLVYVVYVLYKIKTDNLMPPTGKRRILTVYFLRLAIVFVIMWLPALLFLFILGAWIPHWLVWAGGAWSHLQGLVSSLLSLGKPDVLSATRHLVRCKCHPFDEDEDLGDEDGPGNTTTNGGKKLLNIQEIEEQERQRRHLELQGLDPSAISAIMRATANHTYNNNEQAAASSSNNHNNKRGWFLNVFNCSKSNSSDEDKNHGNNKKNNTNNNNKNKKTNNMNTLQTKKTTKNSGERPSEDKGIIAPEDKFQDALDEYFAKNNRGTKNKEVLSGVASGEGSSQFFSKSAIPQDPPLDGTGSSPFNFQKPSPPMMMMMMMQDQQAVGGTTMSSSSFWRTTATAPAPPPPPPPPPTGGGFWRVGPPTNTAAAPTTTTAGAGNTTTTNTAVTTTSTSSAGSTGSSSSSILSRALLLTSTASGAPAGTSCCSLPMIEEKDHEEDDNSTTDASISDVITVMSAPSRPTSTMSMTMAAAAAAAVAAPSSGSSSSQRQQQQEEYFSLSSPQRRQQQQQQQQQEQNLQEEEEEEEEELQHEQQQQDQLQPRMSAPFAMINMVGDIRETDSSTSSSTVGDYRQDMMMDHHDQYDHHYLGGCQDLTSMVLDLESGVELD